MEINNRIKELRQYLNLTQEEFGKELGLTKSNISDLERGKVRAKDSLLRLIEHTFSVNPSWLREGKGEMFLPKPEPSTDSFEEAAEIIVNRIIEKRGLKISSEKRKKVIKKLAELIKRVGEKEALDLIDLAV